MRALLSIAGRELSERWTWIGLSLVLGLAAFLASTIGVGDARTLRILTASGFLAMLAVTTIVVGAGIMTRDLAEGRLAFFYSRPLHWWSLWGGKYLAAVVLAASSLLVMAGGILAERGPRGILRDILDKDDMLLLACLFVAGVGIAHIAGVVLGARSRWTWLDLTLLAAVLYLAAHMAVRLVRTGLVRLDNPRLFLCVFATLALLFLPVSAAQYAVGRVSLRRSHAVLSLVLWGLLLPPIAGAMAYLYWSDGVEPSQLPSVQRASAPRRGSWTIIVAERRAPGGASAVLFDTASRHALALEATRLGAFSSPCFSADGQTVAWPDLGGSLWDLGVGVVYARLTPAGAIAQRLSIPAPRLEQWTPLVLSPTGQRLLVVRPTSVDAYALPDGRLLASARIGASVQRQAFFRDEDHARVYAQRAKDGPLEILEVALPAGTVSPSGHIDARGKLWLRLNADGQRALVFDWTSGRIALHGGHDGRLLTTLIERRDRLGDHADFLADGRIALLQVASGAARLEVLSASGEPERAIELGPASQVMLGGEPALGRLFVGAAADGQPWDTLLVDLAQSTVVQRLPGLEPIACRVGPWLAGAPFQLSPGSFLFLDSQKRLVRLDADLGKRAVLIGRQ